MSDGISKETICNNPEKQQFELCLDEHTARIRYRHYKGVLDLTHVGVPSAIGGRGIGSLLVKHALDYARTNELKVIPSCPFVRSYIQTHPEYADLVY